MTYRKLGVRDLMTTEIVLSPAISACRPETAQRIGAEALLADLG